jgi:hypothetical protein
MSTVKSRAILVKTEEEQIVRGVYCSVGER